MRRRAVPKMNHYKVMFLKFLCEVTCSLFVGQFIQKDFQPTVILCDRNMERKA